MYLLLIVLLCINILYIDTLVINRKNNEIITLRNSITELNTKVDTMTSTINGVDTIIDNKINSYNTDMITKFDLMTKKINNINVMVADKINNINTNIINDVDTMTDKINSINLDMNTKFDIKINGINADMNTKFDMMTAKINSVEPDITSRKFNELESKISIIKRVVNKFLIILNRHIPDDSNAHTVNNMLEMNVSPSPLINAIRMLKDYSARTPSQSEKATNTVIIHYIELLLDTGSDITSVVDGETALLEKNCVSNIECVKLLLNRGANINMADKVGKTPLMKTAVSQNHNIVKLLLDSGADKYIKDTEGNTALDSAISSKNAVAVSLLK
jgi:hypothetical protein